MVRRAAMIAVVALAAATAVVSCSASGHRSADGGGAAAAAPEKANFVFVLTDDLSTNLLPYLPHVRAMQREGATFSRYFLTDSLCCPSRSSMLSGRYPHNTGVFTNMAPDGGFGVFHDRHEEASTWGTDLQKAGYRTGFMGKYLNGYKPRDPLGGSKPYVPPGWNEWDVAGNGYFEFSYDLNENGTVVHYGNQPKDYLTDVVASKAVSFIDRAATDHKPFGLEVATFAPHKPSTPAPRDANDFPGLKAPRSPAFDQADKVGIPRWEARLPPLLPREEKEIDQQFRKRAQSVQAVDDLIARLQHELAARHLSHDTYFVFSSDNGYHMGEHRLRPGKMTAFDTDIRVPLVVVGPGVTAGRKIDQIAQNIDFRPTFDEWAGVRPPAEVDGHSLAGLLRDESDARGWRNAAVVEHHGPDVKVGDPDRQPKKGGDPPTYEALRLSNAVYVEYRDGEREYYDIAKDPDELSNVYGQLSAAKRQHLHDELSAITRCGGEGCWKAQHVAG